MRLFLNKSKTSDQGLKIELKYFIEPQCKAEF